MRLAVIALVVAGCGKVQDAPLDASESGCTEVSETCETGNVLRSCAAIGEEPSEIACPGMCATDGGAHCRVLTPSFGLTREDMAPTPGLEEITLASTTTINGNDGSITNVRTAGTGVISGIDFQIRDGVAIFRFGKLTINGTGERMPFSGTQPIALVAMTSITLNNTVLDLQGTCANEAAGPGGSPGGNVGSPLAMASPGMTGGKPGGVAGYCSGGGGGGHLAAGGAGGTGQDVLPGVGGLAAAASAFTGGGGGGGAGSVGGTVPTFGGGGGGAIHLAANQLVRVTGGGILAGGCGGGAGPMICGCGGGAGGMVVIEAEDVELLNSTFAANGGGGGGGGARGMNALFGAGVAAGAQPTAAGGGGAGSVSTAPGVVGGTASGYGGGGGGAAGRIIVSSGDGVIGTGGVVFSPASTTGTSPVE